LININELNSSLHRISNDALKNIKMSLVKLGNTYIVFGLYKIKNDNGYKIYRNSDHIHTVHQLSSALSWCIYDYKNDINSRDQLLDYDRRLSNMYFNVSNLIHILKGKNLPKEQRDVIDIKLKSDYIKYREIKDQWQNFIKAAKYIKIQGLSHGTKKF
jgi:hypothetical protein